MKGAVLMEPMPHAYTNQTIRQHNRVIKAYYGPDAALRRDREATALQQVRTHVPVPPLVAVRADALETQHVAGPDRRPSPAISPNRSLGRVDDGYACQIPPNMRMVSNPPFWRC
jgi:hypothetical protein